MSRALLIAIIAVLAVVHVNALIEIRTGRVLQNGFVHRVNLSDPQDPNMVVINVDGNPNDGWVTWNVSGPHTFCVPPTGACGRDVQDDTVVLHSRHTQLSLHSLTNNPSPFSNGILSDYFATGIWDDHQYHHMVSYDHILTLPTMVIKVPMRSVIAGSIDKHTNRLTGRLFGFVPPYLGPATLPFQYLFTYGVMDSSSPFSVLAGYRAMSPHGTTTSPGFPAAPIDVTGFVTGIAYDGGLMMGKITLHNPGGLVNITNADFVSDFHRDLDIDNLVKINFGIIPDFEGKSYMMTDLNVILMHL